MCLLNAGTDERTKRDRGVAGHWGGVRGWDRAIARARTSGRLPTWWRSERSNERPVGESVSLRRRSTASHELCESTCGPLASYGYGGLPRVARVDSLARLKRRSTARHWLVSVGESTGRHVVAGLVRAEGGGDL